MLGVNLPNEFKKIKMPEYKLKQAKLIVETKNSKIVEIEEGNYNMSIVIKYFKSDHKKFKK